MGLISFSRKPASSNSADSHPYGPFLRLVAAPWQGWYLEETLSAFEMDVNLRGEIS